MSNITLSIDDEIIKQAKIKAVQDGVSLSAKVRELLQRYVSGSDDASRRQREEATAKLMQTIESATLLTQALQASTQPATNVPHKSLREELYADDFRAIARADLSASAIATTQTQP
jgi:plasmid stability protein